MTWLGWVIIGCFSLGALLQVATVGEPRKPLTGGTVAFIVAADAALIVGILTVGTGSLR